MKEQGQYRQLKEEVGSLIEFRENANKFYGLKMPVEMVALLHDVNKVTVRKYVKLGLIETHPESSDAKIIIRASVALTLDFTKLKRDGRRERFLNEFIPHN